MAWDSKARAALAETFLNALKEDKIPWQRCWTAGPLSFSTGKPYRGINNLMLSYMAEEKGYKDTRWMTYKQAQDHGWQVRKGEQSVRVEYWQHYDFKLKKALSREEVARIQREEPERMKDIRLAAYTANVFNVEQIDGDIPPMEQKARVDVGLLRDIREPFLANLGVGFLEGGDRAAYSSKSDTIRMPFARTFTGDYAYMCTLLHEAAHSTGHHTRLDRKLGNRHGSPDYAREELRAEIASAFTAQALQLPYRDGELSFEIENHKAYLQSWIAALEEDPNELFVAIKDADKITSYLLEHGQLQKLVKSAELQKQFRFEYQLLDRLKTDCEYFLGAGGRHEKYLWAGDVERQIAKMRELYDKLPVKPDWLSLKDIDRYEELMKSQPMEVYESQGKMTELEEEYEPEL